MIIFPWEARKRAERSHKKRTQKPYPEAISERRDFLINDWLSRHFDEG